MAETYRVGLLGHGTVGAAFEQLLSERAEHDRARHRRPARGRPACSPARAATSTRSWPTAT